MLIVEHLWGASNLYISSAGVRTAWISLSRCLIERGIMLIAGDPLWTIINFKPLVIKYHSLSSKDVNYHPQKVTVRVCVCVHAGNT